MYTCVIVRVRATETTCLGKTQCGAVRNQNACKCQGGLTHLFESCSFLSYMYIACRYLPPEFPQVKPVITVSPPLRHPFVDEQMQVVRYLPLINVSLPTFLVSMHCRSLHVTSSDLACCHGSGSRQNFCCPVGTRSIHVALERRP